MKLKICSIDRSLRLEEISPWYKYKLCICNRGDVTDFPVSIEYISYMLYNFNKIVGAYYVKNLDNFKKYEPGDDLIFIVFCTTVLKTFANYFIMNKLVLKYLYQVG